MAVREPAPLDGNVLAGSFPTDATTSVLRCTACGRTEVVARTRVYATDMGMVARCVGCGEVLVVAVEHPGGSRVAIPGAAWVGPGP